MAAAGPALTRGCGAPWRGRAALALSYLAPTAPPRPRGAGPRMRAAASRPHKEARAGGRPPAPPPGGQWGPPVRSLRPGGGDTEPSPPKRPQQAALGAGRRIPPPPGHLPPPKTRSSPAGMAAGGAPGTPSVHGVAELWEGVRFCHRAAGGSPHATDNNRPRGPPQPVPIKKGEKRAN